MPVCNASVLALCLASTLLAICTSAATVETIPYAQFRVEVDGDTSEWRAPFRDALIEETQAPVVERNRLRLRMAWDIDRLLIAGEIDDADLILAPAALQVEHFHHYDSAQVYLDPFGDSTTRMNGDDIDLILLPDGRAGLLRGDDLVAELAQARVPQRQSAPMAYAYATRRQTRGWSFELAIPFSAIGLTEPAARQLKIDIAINDWVSAHPPAQAQAISAASLQEARSSNLDVPAPEIGRLLWPLNWQGERDFGYPARWRTFRLDGTPPASVRWLRRFGAGSLLSAALLLALAAAVTAAAITAWHARRRLRRLLARMRLDVSAHADGSGVQIADAGTGTGAAAAPQTQAAEPTADDAPDASAPQPPPDFDPRDRAFAERVLAHVRAHLQEELTPTRLAEAMHVSVRSLQRRLRQGMDSSPQDLVLAARLQAAHELLRRGDLRVGEVAFRVGFSDLSHFSRRFRAAYGIAPSDLQP